jgi:hypothetical protein
LVCSGKERITGVSVIEDVVQVELVSSLEKGYQERASGSNKDQGSNKQQH